MATPGALLHFRGFSSLGIWTRRLCRNHVIKLPLFVAAGVEWTWLVDPTAQTFEVFQAVEGRAVLALSSGADAVIAPPFHTQISLSEWWLRSGEGGG